MKSSSYIKINFNVMVFNNNVHSFATSYNVVERRHTWTPIAKKLLDNNFITACHARS